MPRRFGKLLWVVSCTALAAAALSFLTAWSGGASRTKAAAACARNKTLIVDIDTGRVVSPKVWNPYLPSVQLDNGFMQTMIEPLFIYSAANDKTYPWLALSMTPSAKYRRWVLKLRPGVKWSDGKPFTADDVVFTIKMLIQHAPKLGQLGESQGMKSEVASVKKLGKLTVVFQLKRPDPRFKDFYFTAENGTSIFIVPKHIWAKQNPLKFTNYNPGKGWPVFTGPYTLATASPTSMVYKLNPNWWGAKTGFKPVPAVKCVNFIAPGSVETKGYLLIRHQLDSVMDIDPGTFDSVRKQNPNLIAWRSGPPWAWVDNCVRNLELNLKHKPWDNPKVRWALSLAIDRQKIVQYGYRNTTTAADSIFPTYPPLNRFVALAKSSGLYKKHPLGTQNLQAATKLLQSQGYAKKGSYWTKNGKRLSLKIETTSDFIEYERLAQVLVEELQNFGINATLHLVADPTLEDNYGNGNFHATVLGWSTCNSVNEPWSTLDTLSNRWLVPVGQPASYDGMRWNNKQYSRIVAQMSTLPDNSPKYAKLFLKAYQIYLNQLPVIPITQARKLVPFDTKYWKGWPTSRNPYMSPTMWYQSAELIILRLRPA
jgi:peptide/nickel transport system substrate-binding protein